MDAEPDDRGNAVLSDRGGTIIVRQVDPGVPLYPSEKRRQFHHATCPDREQWRKKDRA